MENKHNIIESHQFINLIIGMNCPEGLNESVEINRHAIYNANIVHILFVYLIIHLIVKKHQLINWYKSIPF